MALLSGIQEYEEKYFKTSEEFSQNKMFKLNL